MTDREKFIEILAKVTDYPIEKIEQCGEEDWLVSVSQALQAMQSAADGVREEKEKYIIVESYKTVNDELYDTGMRVKKSDHPKYTTMSRFDFGFMQVAINEGYSVTVLPAPPSNSNT